MMKESIPCIICGRDCAQPYLKVRDRFDPDGGEYQLVQCECGFVYLNPRPDAAHIGRYYEHRNYDPHRKDSTSLFDRLYGLAQRFTFRWKRKIIERWNLAETKRLLDIGGGRGDLDQYLTDRQWHVLVQDRSEAALGQARDFGLETVQNLDEIPGSELFDCITMWHALEHIHDTEHLMDRINRLLKRDGRLLVAVPNLNAPERGWFRERWAPFDAPRHLYHFDADSLETFLNQSGFTVLRMYSMPLEPVYNILLSSHGLNLKTVLFAGWVLVTSLFRNLAKGSRYGSGILAVCRMNY